MNNYLIKARDAYPYDLNEAWENLNYAMSFEEENPDVHCLLGKFYYEQWNKFAEAEHHFRLAIVYEAKHVDTHLAMVNMLFVAGRGKEALGWIERTKALPTVCSACMSRYEAVIYERSGDWKAAIAHLKRAMQESTNNSEIADLKEDLNRVMDKIKITQDLGNTGSVNVT